MRSLLSGDRIAIIGGAHDALSARLVEEAQYDGVWAGSFAMSVANRCLPDADLLTMNEVAANIVRIAHYHPQARACGQEVPDRS